MLMAVFNCLDYPSYPYTPHSAFTKMSSTPAKIPINIALFGVGRWGVHLLRNFLAHPLASVVAVVDPEAAQLAAISQKFQLDQRVKLITDWQTVMAMADVDAVVIATPAVTHYALIKQALQQGRHVLAEKPLTLDPKEGVELCQLAEQRDCQLVVDHTYLFHPAVQRGRTVIQQGGVGDLRYGYATRTHLGPVRQDVDALWDLAIHDIAIFNHWLREEPIQVQAQGTGWLQPQADAASMFPMGLSDLVWLTLTYPSGFQAVIHLCWSNPDKQRRLCLVGNRGTLVFDELRPEAMLTLRQGQIESQDGKFIPAGIKQKGLTLAVSEPLGQVCDHFLTCVRENRSSHISSGWVGSGLVTILSDLSDSLNRGGPTVMTTLRHNS